MGHTEILDSSALHGTKAIMALIGFKDDLKTRNPRELTERQIDALIRVAEALIASIEAEEQSTISLQQRKKTLFGS